MVASKPELSVFTGTENLGQIYEESNEIIVRFFETNIPLGSSANRIQLNFGGKMRVLLVQGAMSGTGFTGATPNDKIAQFVYLMEQWANSTGIQGSRVYTDSLGNTYNVNAFNFKWRRLRNDPNRIIYTLLMKET